MKKAKKCKKEEKVLFPIFWESRHQKKVLRHKWEQAVNLRDGVPGRTNGCILVNFNPI